MDDLWTRLEQWLSTHVPQLCETLRGPASPDILREVQALFGERLSADVLALYARHDGEEPDGAGLFYGVRFLPWSEVRKTLELWSSPAILEMNDNPDIRSQLRSRPLGKIKKLYANPRWIPLTHDGRGNHIGVDLDPGWLGKRGQVIVFGRDEDVKHVAAPSLRSFFSTFVAQLEAGNFVVEKGRPSPKRSLDGRPMDPDYAHFHNMFLAGR